METSTLITRSKPVSDQVQEILRSRILHGSYLLDERMPSEERLARELEVSRATVRTALVALENEGLVRRRHGDGTYPTPHAFEIVIRARDAWNIERQIEESGRIASTRLLEQGFRSPTPQESQGLALEAGEPVFAIRRLFLANDVPVMLALHVVRGPDLAPDFPPEAARLPLLEFLARYSRRPLQSGETRFKAVLAEADIAAALKVEPGSAVLLLEAVLKDDYQRPLLLAWEYYPGEEGFHLPVAPFHR